MSRCTAARVASLKRHRDAILTMRYGVRKSAERFTGNNVLKDIMFAIECAVVDIVQVSGVAIPSSPKFPEEIRPLWPQSGDKFFKSTPDETGVSIDFHYWIQNRLKRMQQFFKRKVHLQKQTWGSMTSTKAHWPIAIQVSFSKKSCQLDSM